MKDTSTVTVLVHGLWLHGVAMHWQRNFLRRKGFDAICYSYPSMRLSLSQNADRLARFGISLDASVVHWVGHSLGGIVILRAMKSCPALPSGRIVLLGAPVQGTFSGRTLAGRTCGARMVGRSIGEFLRQPDVEIPAGREVGVIAGSAGVGLGRLFAPSLAVPHDGTVSVAETRLAGACDSLILPVSHTSMLFSRNVAHQTAKFLRHGQFEHGLDTN